MKNLLFLVILALFSCGKDDNRPNSEWLIPSDEVQDGGPGKDGIPSVDNPQFDNVADITFLDDNDLVSGVVHDGVAKAYPHPILDWHEIVNDNLADINYALTYCPLTGTGIAWDRNVNGVTTTFGVSGKLYNTNLLPYDRATDSYWSQIRLDCVNGENIGTKIATFPVIETTWATWKSAYPNSSVMNTSTGFSRDYNDYPYGDYRTNHDRILFAVNPMDNRLPAKERALLVISENTNKVYSIELFDGGRVIEDNIDGVDIVIIGSKEDNYIVAYEQGDLSQFNVASGQGLPIVATAQNGNTISLDGTVVNGPLQGTQLKAMNSFIGYYFSLAAFYDVEIYE